MPRAPARPLTEIVVQTRVVTIISAVDRRESIEPPGEGMQTDLLALTRDFAVRLPGCVRTVYSSTTAVPLALTMSIPPPEPIAMVS